MDAAASLDTALRHHRAGDLDRAEQLYLEVLEQQPDHADAWHLLGVVATHRGQAERAVQRIERALEMRPGDAAYHLNLGVALQLLGRTADAEASFRRAIEAKPDFVEAHNNLANSLRGRGATDDALRHWRRALTLRPDFADARYNLATTLVEQGEFAEALQHAQEAVRLRPMHAGSHLALGNALAELRRPEEAEAAFRTALGLRPDWAAGRVSLARVLRRQGQLEAALAIVEEALRLEPRSADGHVEIGAVLGCLGRDDEAAGHLYRALWLRPGDVEAHTNLGVLCNATRRFAEASEHFRAALRGQPDLLEASAGLALALYRLGDLDGTEEAARRAVRHRPTSGRPHAMLAEALVHQGRLDEAVAEFREALRLEPALSGAHSGLLMALNYLPDIRPEELLAEHRRWEECHGRLPPVGPPPGVQRRAGTRLRIGYVSPDLVRHVLVRFFEPVLEQHDPQRVEVFCYANALVGDETTERLRSLVPHWRSTVGRSDEAVARQVVEDQIDVLVDLAGHTGGRLGVFARRPAPVQVSWLGYPATTGLSAIQYRLTDAVCDPPGEPACHTEELVRLPGGFCCYKPPADAPAVGPAPCLSRGYVMFGSTHKLEKLNGAVLDLWCEVLRAVPSSRLLVFRNTLRALVAERLRGEFARRGIAPGRVELRHEATNSGPWLAAYHEIDVLLDCFPWSGHATACEALWMGVPVVTLLGDRHAGRMVASLLTQIGRSQWIARNRIGYIASALTLAQDQEDLATIRAGMRQNFSDSLLLSSTDFTRRLENTFQALLSQLALE